MSTSYETATTIFLYYALVLSGREFMRNRRAFNFNRLFMVHNFCLTLVSGALLLLFAQQLVPTIRMHGTYYSICGPGGWTTQLASLYYVCSDESHNKAGSLTIPRSTTLSNTSNWLTRCFSFCTKSLCVRHPSGISISPGAYSLCSLSSLLPSWSNSPAMLCTTERAHLRIMGTDYPELDRTCADVLVLFPKCPGGAYLVEGVDHTASNCAVRP